MLDQTSAEDVTKAFIFEHSTLAASSLYAYHYLLTLDDEVAHIWPQKWTLGKVVFLLARYMPFLRIATDTCLNVRIWASFGEQVCVSLVWLFSLSYHFQTVASDGEKTFARASISPVNLTTITAAFLLCVYALLGAERIHSTVLLAVYSAFTVAISALLVISLVSSKYVSSQNLSYDAQHNGQACHILFDARVHIYEKISDYLIISGTIVAALLGVLTIVIRYRSQNNSLINVIRRDGGMFYLSALALRLSTMIIALPNIQVHVYNLIYTTQEVALPMLAAGLILNVRKIDDPGTRDRISTLIFTSRREEFRLRRYR
ncbi:hypothetical protein DFP72DRAFT_1169812 [Ephemerocybe angulata]|uniref:DUF6533 domain-containing protein n=1 Tax=Ephemerocybe angulata TaxID=980116 RepID=A0A8H6I0J7_9AGAR|nr:hypothetical protein DFP72DRAFT_1169812 [Tulosesus angulatus]